jgi:hypothetical protein
VFWSVLKFPDDSSSAGFISTAQSMQHAHSAAMKAFVFENMGMFEEKKRVERLKYCLREAHFHRNEDDR